ncbi:hypothetical protein CR513_47464, partial [Mucuna pruriens]
MKLRREKEKKRMKGEERKINEGEKRKKDVASKAIMLESFHDIFPKDIPRGWPPIRGTKHQTYFTMGATLSRFRKCWKGRILGLLSIVALIFIVITT